MNNAQGGIMSTENFNFKTTYRGHKLSFEVHTGHDGFPFWDAYCDGKWLTCSQEDEFDIECKALAIIDAQEAPYE
jgi:hypothetical protein